MQGVATPDHARHGHSRPCKARPPSPPTRYNHPLSCEAQAPPTLQGAATPDHARHGHSLALQGEATPDPARRAHPPPSKSQPWCVIVLVDCDASCKARPCSGPFCCGWPGLENPGRTAARPASSPPRRSGSKSKVCRGILYPETVTEDPIFQHLLELLATFWFVVGDGEVAVV
ncbi:hypothetical protein PG984_006533 [Apiospora sp. TS-2023a]